MEEVQEELAVQVQRPARRREGPSHVVLALLGASLVVLSVVVRPPVRAGFGLAGFLLWLLGVARLLLLCVGSDRAAAPGAPAALAGLAAATAKLAVEKLKHLFFGRQVPPPELAAAAPA